MAAPTLCSLSQTDRWKATIPKSPDHPLIKVYIVDSHDHVVELGVENVLYVLIIIAYITLLKNKTDIRL